MTENGRQGFCRPPFVICSLWSVVCPLSSGVGQLPGNRRNDARIGRLDRGREYRCDVALAAHQVFVEIPAWGLERALRGGPLVEWVGVRSLDLDLGGEREGDPVMLMRGLADLFGGPRLLPAEL